MDDVQSIWNSAGKVRTRSQLAAWLLIGLLFPRWMMAADSWGGSIAATSDYLVRGISRSNQDPALQADLHVVTDGGFIAGMFASSTQLDPHEPRDAELSAFVGFAWQPSSAWRAKILASYYAYPWNAFGSRYNYAELLIEAAYNDWLEINVAYSPDARYLPDDSPGVSATSAEITARTPWRHRMAATAGIGHLQFSDSVGGYTYWSAAGLIDLAPWMISVAFVDTDAAARSLFYGDAAHDRWVATVIWRF
jgi:uncharacterized protein (TIGR02001 family)